MMGCKYRGDAYLETDRCGLCGGVGVPGDGGFEFPCNDIGYMTDIPIPSSREKSLENEHHSFIHRRSKENPYPSYPTSFAKNPDTLTSKPKIVYLDIYLSSSVPSSYLFIFPFVFFSFLPSSSFSSSTPLLPRSQVSHPLRLPLEKWFFLDPCFRKGNERKVGLVCPCPVLSEIYLYLARIENKEGRKQGKKEQV